MKRPYAEASTVPPEAVRAFIGVESTNTHAKNVLTLFVVGRPGTKMVVTMLDQASTIPRVVAHKQMIQHLHFGANNSFDGEQIIAWSEMIRYFLKESYWCSLSFRPGQIPLVLKMSLCKHARFIPIINVKVPHIESLGGNTVLKIDDIGFARTNKGTWSLGLHNTIINKETLTPWTHYREDVIVAVDLTS